MNGTIGFASPKIFRDYATAECCPNLKKNIYGHFWGLWGLEVNFEVTDVKISNS